MELASLDDDADEEDDDGGGDPSTAFQSFNGISFVCVTLALVAGGPR